MHHIPWTSESVGYSNPKVRVNEHHPYIGAAIPNKGKKSPIHRIGVYNRMSFFCSFCSVIIITLLTLWLFSSKKKILCFLGRLYLMMPWKSELFIRKIRYDCFYILCVLHMWMCRGTWFIRPSLGSAKICRLTLVIRLSCHINDVLRKNFLKMSDKPSYALLIK